MNEEKEVADLLEARAAEVKQVRFPQHRWEIRAHRFSVPFLVKSPARRDPPNVNPHTTGEGGGERPGAGGGRAHGRGQGRPRRLRRGAYVRVVDWSSWYVYTPASRSLTEYAPTQFWAGDDALGDGGA